MAPVWGFMGDKYGRQKVTLDLNLCIYVYRILHELSLSMNFYGTSLRKFKY